MAPADGFVTGFDAEGVGRTAMLLGAGRATKDAVIDPGAGLVLEVRAGDSVSAGDPLATLYAADESLFDEASSRLLASIHIGDTKPEPMPLFHEV